MAGTKQVLFYLDEQKKERLSCDDLQWIVERGNSRSACPGKDSGYRGISFVCTRKEILWEVMGDKCVDLTVATCELLVALPDDFLTFRALLDRLGIEGFKAWLKARVGKRRGGRTSPERRKLRRQWEKDIETGRERLQRLDKISRSRKGRSGSDGSVDRGAKDEAGTAAYATHLPMMLTETVRDFHDDGDHPGETVPGFSAGQSRARGEAARP